MRMGLAGFGGWSLDDSRTDPYFGFLDVLLLLPTRSSASWDQTVFSVTDGRPSGGVLLLWRGWGGNAGTLNLFSFSESDLHSLFGLGPRDPCLSFPRGKQYPLCGRKTGWSFAVAAEIRVGRLLRVGNPEP